MKLEWQLEERRSDELGVLENSLNTLSRKLSATLEELQSANLQLQKDIEHQKVLERAQQDFFSSASHELKTPITIIKGQLEGMLLGIGCLLYTSLRGVSVIKYSSFDIIIFLHGILYRGIPFTYLLKFRLNKIAAQWPAKAVA